MLSKWYFLRLCPSPIFSAWDVDIMQKLYSAKVTISEESSNSSPQANKQKQQQQKSLFLNLIVTGNKEQCFMLCTTDCSFEREWVSSEVSRSWHILEAVLQFGEYFTTSNSYKKVLHWDIIIIIWLLSHESNLLCASKNA